MTTTTRTITATITAAGLAPYGIGEIIDTIEIPERHGWAILAERVEAAVARMGPTAWGQVTVTYSDADGDEVDIYAELA